VYIQYLTKHLDPFRAEALRQAVQDLVAVEMKLRDEPACLAWFRSLVYILRRFDKTINFNSPSRVLDEQRNSRPRGEVRSRTVQYLPIRYQRGAFRGGHKLGIVRHNVVRISGPQRNLLRPWNKEKSSIGACEVVKVPDDLYAHGETFWR
jgi:hypothetical protein